MIVDKKWLFIVPIELSLLAITALVPERFLVSGVFFIWLDMIIYSLDNTKDRSALFAFLISFFLFLIGRELLETFGLHSIEFKYEDSINIFTHFLLILSLIFIFLGYIVSDHVRVRSHHVTNVIDYESAYYKTVRKVSKLIFGLTYAFNLLELIDVVRYVFQHGYLSLYTSYSSSMPYVVGKIGDISIIAYYIFLGTFPDKDEIKVPTIFYTISLLVSLGTGSRFQFASGLLMLTVYWMARNRINSGGDIWFGRREWLLVFLMLPVLLTVLFAIGNIRMGNDSTIRTKNILDSITDFFYKQGVSSNIIKRTKVYADIIPKKSYLFGTTYEMIHNNVIFRLLGVEELSGNTVRHAVDGFSYQHAISYAIMGNYYLQGHGYGSCFIAEAYHDLGYLGVMLVSFIYGCIINKMFNFSNKGIWRMAVLMTALHEIILAPRGSADGFIASLVDMTTWGSILIIYFISNQIYRKSVAGLAEIS